MRRLLCRAPGKGLTVHETISVFISGSGEAHIVPVVVSPGKASQQADAQACASVCGAWNLDAASDADRQDVFGCQPEGLATQSHGRSCSPICQQQPHLRHLRLFTLRLILRTDVLQLVSAM